MKKNEGDKNCMMVAATKFLGFEPPSTGNGEVHEEIVIDLAIENGMHPVRINFYPVSIDKNGNESPAYTHGDAIKRFIKYAKNNKGIIIGKRNGVWHADTDIQNFDVVERGIFDINIR